MPLKRRSKLVFQDRLLLNAGQKYCRMLQGENSAKLSTFIKLPFVINIPVLSISEWLLKTGFTVVTESHMLTVKWLQLFLCSSIFFAIVDEYLLKFN